MKSGSIVVSAVLILIGSISFWSSSMYYGAKYVKARTEDDYRLEHKDKCNFIGIQVFSWVIWGLGLIIGSITIKKKMNKK